MDLLNEIQVQVQLGSAINVVMMNKIFAYAFVAIAGYLLGSIPTGFLVAKAKGVDIRKQGSGNIGATNVFRTLGKKLGIFVFLCDALKGVFAVLLAEVIYRMIAIGDNVPAIVGIVGAVTCILGHNFPAWLKFKGGKGVATSLGVIIGLVPLQAAIAFALFVIILFASGYVSLASIFAALSVPVTVALFGPPQGKTTMLVFTILASLLIVLRHKANIKRLLNGTENRFKKPKETKETKP